ncbi:capsule biosynthesis protein [Hoeflea ulvae]|uniref:Capsule biosynthesis protein n=1 Tax=Hoeflea ulvae TaxID=2983764 RepID=A0ABT3YKH6_9HYPH|nr:capsule biosynthesis protein [Hoeflea ulvae]MCY0096388.1 capsule biosynthesis protein [Hoeflea ulvae]
MTHTGQHEDNSGRQQVGIQASRDVSARLTAAARLLRLSTSSRSNLFKIVGLRPRMLDRLFTIVSILLLVFCLIVPSVTALAYYGYFASDQYESETRFTVRSSAPALGNDQIAEVTGIPSAKIVQDTQIAMNFIGSHEMLDVLEERDISLHEIYGDNSIDWWARLPDDASREDLLEYWNHMVSTSVSPSSGIVVVTVRAFTAEDSALLARAILTAAEYVVNRVNDRIWKDVIETSNTNLENAKTQLLEARQALARARNRDGVLTVEGSSAIVTNLISAMEGERLNLQHRYDANLAVVSPTAPQMLVLKREIESKQQQIAELKSQLAGSAEGARNLADVSQEMSQLQLAQSLAEQQFAASLKTVEQIQFVSRQQLLYLESFLDPRTPDEAMYPKRILSIFLSFLASLLLWGALLGILHTIRNQISN